MNTIMLFEDFTKLYRRWKGGEIRKEDDYLRKFISKQEHPETININKDGIVNCDCDITIEDEDLVNGKLPFKFGYVSGRLTIANCNIVSLEGLPDSVGEDFDLRVCTKLTSLEGAPQEVGVNFYLTGIPVENLIGCPQEIGGSFKIYGCNNLTSLEGAPQKINNDFSVLYCENMKSLKYLSKEIGGALDILFCGKDFDKNEIPNDCLIKGEINLN